MTTETLQIDITSVDNTGKPTAFSKNSNSTAGAATVGASGDIDISGCSNPVTISWTFADSTGQNFRSTNPITFAPALGTSQNNGVFGSTTMSNGDKTATIEDQNPDAAHRGSNGNLFNFTIHDTATDDDPSIRNR